MKNHEIMKLVNHMTAIAKRTDNNATFNLFTFATAYNTDQLYPLYMEIMNRINETFMRHVKKDEKGAPMEKVKIIQMGDKEEKPQGKQYEFEDEEAYHKDIDAIYERDEPVQLVKYPIQELLECKIKFGDVDSFVVLKYIGL